MSHPYAWPTRTTQTFNVSDFSIPNEGDGQFYLKLNDTNQVFGRNFFYNYPIFCTEGIVIGSYSIDKMGNAIFSTISANSANISTIITSALTNNGISTFNGNISVNSNVLVNGTSISPTEFSYVDGTTSNIQGQFTVVNSTISAIIQRITGITYASTTTNIGQNTIIAGSITATIGTFSGIINANSGILLPTGQLFNMQGNFSCNSTTITPVIFSYLSTVSSNIQTQLNAITGNITLLQTKTTDLTFSGSTSTFANNVTLGGLLTINGSLNLPATKIFMLNGSILVAGLTITDIEVSYLDGVSSNIQAQFNAINSNPHTWGGSNIFSQTIICNLGINSPSGMAFFLTNTSFPASTAGGQLYGTQLYNSVNGVGDSVFVNGSGSGSGGMYFYTHGYYVDRLLLFYVNRTVFNTQGLNYQSTGSVNCAAISATSGTFSLTLAVTGVSTFSNNIIIGGQTLTPTQVAYLSGGTQNINTAITALQQKTTDITFSSLITSIANALVINGDMTSNGIFNVNNNILVATQTLTPTQVAYLSGGTQNINTAITTLQQKTTDITFASLITSIANNMNINGNLTMASAKKITFAASIAQKIILYPSTTLFNNYMFAVENGTIRYNCETNAVHLFSMANTSPTGTAFTDLMRIGVSGTSIYTALTISGLTTGANLNLSGALNFGSTLLSKKLILYDGSFGYDYFGFGIENGVLRYNVSGISLSHVFSSANVGLNGYTTQATINSTGISTTGGIFSGLVQTNSCSISNDFFASGSGVFPTTNTGTNQGLALYWNQSGGGGEVDYLSRGQGGFGGHRFYRSNNTTVPTLMLDMTSTVSTFSDDVTVNGKLNITGVSTLNEITSTSLITFDDPTPTFVTTYNNTGLAATFTIGAYYGKQITISSPISFKQNGSVAPPNSSSFTGTFTSATCSILKGGVAFSTPVVTSTNGFAIVKTYTGSPNNFNVEQYFTNLIVSFQPTVQSTTAIYTINFSLTGNVTNLNTTVSTVSSSNVNVFSPSGVGYVAANYSESLYNIGGRTGHVEMKDLNISNNLLVGGNMTASSINTSTLVANGAVTVNSLQSNTSTSLNTLNATGASNLNSLNYSGMPGAYCVDGNLSGIQYPICYSITNYNDFYGKSTSSTVVPSVGTICTDLLNLNDKDNLYYIMPNYGLIVYDTIGWTGAVTVNVTNTSKYPIWCAPNNYDRGSSCRLYYNGFELT